MSQSMGCSAPRVMSEWQVLFFRSFILRRRIPNCNINTPNNNAILRCKVQTMLCDPISYAIYVMVRGDRK